MNIVNNFDHVKFLKNDEVVKRAEKNLSRQASLLTNQDVAVKFVTNSEDCLFASSELYISDDVESLYQAIMVSHVYDKCTFLLQVIKSDSDGDGYSKAIPLAFISTDTKGYFINVKPIKLGGDQNGTVN